MLTNKNSTFPNDQALFWVGTESDARTGKDLPYPNQVHLREPR